VLLGPPGAGKGTMAGGLANSAGLSVFVTGDVLRAAIAGGSELGVKVKSTVEAGRLVDDETILSLVHEFLRTHSQGALFDGFPRTIKQAEGLRSLLSAEDELRVVYLDTSKETIVARLGARRVCPECGRIYNVRFKPPRNDEVCDDCSASLIRRNDDTDEVIKSRYELYLAETAPLVNYFSEELLKVNGDLPGEEALEIVRGELCPA